MGAAAERELNNMSVGWTAPGLSRADLMKFGCLEGFVSWEDFSGSCGAMINMLVCLTIEIILLSLCISQCCITDMNCSIYNLYFYLKSYCAT